MSNESGQWCNSTSLKAPSFDIRLTLPFTRSLVYGLNCHRSIFKLGYKFFVATKQTWDQDAFLWTLHHFTEATWLDASEQRYLNILNVTVTLCLVINAVMCYYS